MIENRLATLPHGLIHRLMSLHMRSCMLLVLSLLGFTLSSTAIGAITLSVSDVTLAPGASGSVDVTIESDNIVLDDPLQFFDVSYLITTLGVTRLEFVDPQPEAYLTDPDYVFAGDSFAALFPPAGAVSLTTVPNDTYLVSDFTDSLMDVNVTSPKLLARLHVTAATALPPQPGDMFSISPTVNFLTDSLGNDIPFAVNSGTVTISQTQSVIPEPSTLAVWTLILCAVFIRCTDSGRARMLIDPVAAGIRQRVPGAQ
jgi:hypothetical protein